MRGLRALAYALIVLVALLVAAAGALWWWSGTEGSLEWALQRLAKTQPFTAEGVQGSLRSGLRVTRLRWQQDGIEVEAFDVHLEWQPLPLVRKQLKLDEFEAARVRVKDSRPPQPSAAPQSLQLPLRIAIDRMKIGRVEWATASATGDAAQLAGAYEFNGARHKLQLDGVQWAGGSYRGKATVDADGKLPVDAQLEGRWQTTVPGSTATLPLTFTATVQGPIADLQARAQLQSGATASSPSATATARITAWADQPIPQGQAQFRNVDAGALWPQAPHTQLQGQASVQPAGTGSWQISVDVANEAAGPWDKDRLPVRHVLADIEWRAAGQALVRNLDAQVGGGRLQANGDWKSSGTWSVQSKLNAIDPADLHSAMASLPIGGRADLKGEGQAVAFDVDLLAPPNARAARSKRDADEFAATLGALELRQAVARGKWNEGLLSLSTLNLRTSDASLQAVLELRPATLEGSGRATLSAPGLQAQADGKVAKDSGGGTARVSSASLAPALAWLKRLPAMPAAVKDLSLAGRGDVQLAWQGGWRDPTVQASVALPLVELREGGKRPQGASPPVSWTVRDAAATARGRLSEARLTARGRAEQGPRKLAIELAGTGGQRTQKPQAWQGRIDSLNLSASDPSVGAGTWTLRLQRAFDVRWAAGAFEAGASEAVLSAPPRPADRSRAALAPTILAWQPVTWRAGELRTAGRLSALPLAWIELIGGPQLAGSALSGDMVFDAQWDANLGATPRVRASIARSSGDVSVLAENAEGHSTRVRAGVRQARVEVANEGESVTATLAWDSERAGNAQGRLVTRLVRGGAAGWLWPDSAPLSGSLRAQLPRIGVWSLLAPPGWRLRGSLSADVAVAGTKADPRLSGRLLADDLALRSVVDGVQLQGGRLRARLDGTRLVIEEFLLHGAGQGEEGGTLRATGEGSWSDGGPQAQLTARLTRLRASIRSDREVTASGELVARLDAKGTRISGNLKIDQARIVLPDEGTPQLGDDVVVRGAGGPVTAGEARAADQASRQSGRALNVAVDVDLGNEFRVQGLGIDTRLRGSLTVAAESISQPRLVGTIRAVGGEYRAYGQRLRVERGVIRFTGPIDNPALDILALRPNMLERVGVMVTGRALSPFVRLYSEPDRPDVEKLSLLVTGRPAPATGAESALVQQAALALLASRAGGKGGPGIAGRLGLDELSVKRTANEGPAVTLGKRFGQNFYAAYERSLSGALGTLYVFYDLTRRLTLRAEAGERTAVDLIFTLTFN